MLALIALAGWLAFGHGSSHRVAADAPKIVSGHAGYCLDDYKDNPQPNNPVVSWQCNGTAAQVWSASGLTIKHGGTCLSVLGNTKSAGSKVVAASCQSEPGQIWLRDQNGFYNPNSGECLSLPGTKTGQQLVVATCDLNRPGEVWQESGQPTQSQAGCSGSERQKVACYAALEWTRWQDSPAGHEALLGEYTDNAPYEEWCADFVSYVYKEAGAPFTQAYDGWDENNANSIQADTGFTMHLASSGYVPQAGDIAYFDYNGGHVEIVASGGKAPTFIYGDSAAIDPTTGNGQMKANTTINDGSEGHLIYYLSPSST